MNTKPLPSFSPVTRRSFLKTGAIVTAGLASLSLPARAQVNKNSKLRIFQIGVGGIGSLQRDGLKGHPMVEWAGFCDVDRREIDRIKKEQPNAWTLSDYREAFANRAGDFDAVIVDIPDFHHAPAMLTALKHNKHVYGQKPLVHQLAELRMIRDGLKARPGLVTQMGNQRACNRGRMISVEILRRNQLGRPVEAHVWTGGISRGHYFADPWSAYPAAKPVPEYLNWDLWRGPLNAEIPYSEDLSPRRWRAFWETGGGQLADWGCHLLDLLYFAYDLPSPEAVITHTPRPSNTGHTAHNQSTVTYAGGGKFAREKFVVHYNDDALLPSFAALGLPPVKPGANHTMVVCEEGTLLLQADGAITIFRKGKEVEDEPLPTVAPRNHWKDWADNCLGATKPLWTPFDIGWRITEPALLAVKATRFPGQELRWDAANFRFSNHDKANQEILSRNYREGFAPPAVADASSLLPSLRNSSAETAWGRCGDTASAGAGFVRFALDASHFAHRLCVKMENRARFNLRDCAIETQLDRVRLVLSVVSFFAVLAIAENPALSQGSDPAGKPGGNPKSTVSPGIRGTNSTARLVLTNSRSILLLSPREAEKQFPVRLVGQVVYADPGSGVWFLMDDTAGISLSRPSPEIPLELGSIVEVEGVSMVNNSDLAVEARQVKRLGSAPLPSALPITSDQLVDVLTDFQWVEVEAVVESVRAEDGHLHLVLSGVRDIRAFIPGFPEATGAPTHWVDARLRLRGVWTTKIGTRGRYEANHLFVPSLEQVQVVKPRALEAGEIPVQPLERALRFNAHAGESRRIKVVGVVTATPSKSVFYIQDSFTGLRVHTRQIGGFTVGDRVEVVGFPSLEGAVPQLEEALVRRLSPGAQPEPVVVDPATGRLEDGSMEGVLARVVGETVGVVPQGTLAELVVRVGDKYVSARLSGTNAAQSFSRFRPFSRVQLTGVCVLLSQNGSLVNKAQLILRSAEDVVLLKAEPWWTVPKALAVLATISALLLYWRLRGWRRELRIENRYRMLFENASELVCVNSTDGVFLDANPAWVDLTGYPLPVLQKKRLQELVASTDRAAFEGWWSRLRAGEKVAHLPVELVTSSGQRVQIEIRSSISKEGDPISQVETFGRDITERKQAEAERLKLEAQLRQSQKMEAIGTLAGGIAHDFNNILGAIVGNTELAIQDCGPGHAAMESLREISKASQRAIGLVRQILTFSRQEVREQRVLNLRSVADEAVGLLRILLPAGVELFARCDDDVPPVLADQTEIHQVLMNLGTNAWHALEGQSGCINLHLEGVRVDAAFACTRADLPPGRYARVTISDTGKGMDAATVARIFDPFFTTKKVGQGTGLGLSVVHGIVKQYHGAIFVNSTPGRGTTFELYFPATEGECPAPAAPVAPVRPARGHGQRILYLDDETSLATAVTRLLERQGYRVSSFTRVADGLAAFHQNPAGFDLVVTDYNMPGASGLDVAREVRLVRPDLPVMMTSGFITDNLRSAAEATGILLLDSKPIQVEEVCHAIERLAHSSRQQP